MSLLKLPQKVVAKPQFSDYKKKDHHKKFTHIKIKYFTQKTNITFFYFDVSSDNSE